SGVRCAAKAGDGIRSALLSRRGPSASRRGAAASVAQLSRFLRSHAEGREMSTPIETARAAFEAMGIDLPPSMGGLEARSPIDGSALHRFEQTSTRSLETIIRLATAAHREWRC